MTWFAVLMCCLPLAAAEAVSPPTDYINDAKHAATILTQAKALLDEGKLTPSGELQQQLRDRKRYDAAPPAPAVLTSDGKELYKRVENGIVVISRLYLCDKCENLHANHASGFVVSAEGLAVTNYHVLESEQAGDQGFVATTRDGRVWPIVEVLAANEATDVALLRLGGEGFTPVPVARTATVGQRVHAITHPANRFYHYSSGEIARLYMSRTVPKKPPVKVIGITAEYAKGSSGGPIFNDQGQVVAIVRATDSLYYNQKDQKNLQMVFRHCVPYESILALFALDDEGNPCVAEEDILEDEPVEEAIH